MSASHITISCLPSPSTSVTTVRTQTPNGPLRPIGMFACASQRSPLPSAFSNHVSARTTSRSPSPSRSATPAGLMAPWTDGPILCRSQSCLGSSGMRYQTSSLSCVPGSPIMTMSCRPSPSMSAASTSWAPPAPGAKTNRSKGCSRGWPGLRYQTPLHTRSIQPSRSTSSAASSTSDA